MPVYIGVPVVVLFCVLIFLMCHILDKANGIWQSRKIIRESVLGTSTYKNMEGETTEKDSKRLIWSSLHCNYWTDRWNKLDCTYVPVCPDCSSIGFQLTAEEWFTSIDQYDVNHPGYKEAVLDRKERCNWCIDLAILRGNSDGDTQDG